MLQKLQIESDYKKVQSNNTDYSNTFTKQLTHAFYLPVYQH